MYPFSRSVLGAVLQCACVGRTGSSVSRVYGCLVALSMCTNPPGLGRTWCLEWDCCNQMAEPSKKKAKLDSSDRRFGSSQKQDAMEQICKGFVPANTIKATGWAGLLASSILGERSRTHVLLQRNVRRSCWRNLRWSSSITGFLGLWSKFGVSTNSSILCLVSPTFSQDYIATLKHLTVMYLLFFHSVLLNVYAS